MLDGGEAPTAATEAPATGAIDLNELLRSGQKLPPSARPPEPAGADGLEQQSWLQQLKMWAVAQSRLEETPMYQIKEQAFSEQLEWEAEARVRTSLERPSLKHEPTGRGARAVKPRRPTAACTRDAPSQSPIARQASCSVRNIA